MSDLYALIRLHKHELDEKRRALGEVYASIAEIERERRKLEREFEKEKEAIKTAGEVHYTFAHYAETVKQKHKQFDKAEEALEEQADKARDSLMETFGELKKYEMTQEERDRLEEEERSYRESKDLDAIGLESFRRKTES